MLGKSEPAPVQVSEKPPGFHDQEKEELLKRLKHLEEKQEVLMNQQKGSPQSEDDYSLSEKQINFALSLLEKMKHEYELAVEPSVLTVKDLNRLVAYHKYNNKGAIVNLQKKGIVKRKGTA
jgi:DNA-binding MarR family transcriptional regulator